MVDDHHPLLPFTVSCDDIVKDVRYFYSKPCGHLMSVEVELFEFSVLAMLSAVLAGNSPDNFAVTIRVHKGKFQKSQLVSEIFIVITCRDETTTTTITKDNCKSYKDTFDEKSDVIQEFRYQYYLHKACTKLEIVNIN
jgi:hypothetical protein